MDMATWRVRVKASLRRTLARRGLEIRRTDRGVRRTLAAVLAHYRQLGLVPGAVFDVGVGPGTPELYYAFPEARLVLVEPLVEWRPHMEAVRAQRAAEIVLAAAGAQTGEIEIAVHRVPELSSMIGKRPDDATDLQARIVPMVRLDDIWREHQLLGPFVLKVDVEGGELEVLSGATGLLGECELVLLEVAFYQLIQGAPQFHDVVAWMHDHGFVVADLYNGHNRPLDGALAQMDVAFVRENGCFRREHAYGTQAQNDALYQSWGR